MDTIQTILNQFSNLEREQLFSIASSRNPQNSKKLRLFDLLLKKPKHSDSYYSQKIYGTPESSAFPQLKKRLKDEIEEIMVLVKPTRGKNKCQNRIVCLELILKSQLCLARGLHHEGSKLLDKSLKRSIKHQFHDLVLTIYSIAQDHSLSEVLSSKDFPEIEIAIKSHLQILVNQNETEGNETTRKMKNGLISKLVHQLNSNRKHWGIVKSLRESILHDNLEEGLSIIKGVEPQDFNRENDPSAYWQFIVAKLELLILKENYQEVSQICFDHIRLNQKSFEAPIEFYQFHFLALFYQSKFDGALHVLDGPLISQFPNQAWKWHYWKALVKFQQKEYITSIKILHSCQPELKRFCEYYLASKLFEIIILIEQGDQDWLEYKIENFRKLLSRWKNGLNLRIKWTFRAINSLYGSGSKAIPSSSEELKKIISFQNQTPWCPFGFELIRLDKWVSSKQTSNGQ